MRRLFGAILALLLALGSAAWASISVGDIGTATATSGTTVVIGIPTGGVPAGSLIVVVISVKANSLTVSSVKDSLSGDNYSKAAAQNASGVPETETWYCYNSGNLVSGDAITVTMSGTINAAAAVALYATGVETSASPFDSTASSTASFASTTTPSLAMGAAPATANSLVVAAVGFGGNSITLTNPSGWTTPPDLQEATSGSTHTDIAGGHEITSTKDTYAPTLGSAEAGIIELTVFAPSTWTNRPLVRPIFSLPGG